MIGFIKMITANLVGSLHNEPGGFSGRKLSALFAVLMAAYNLRFADKSIAVELTIVWLCFALLCLGIITMQQVIELRSGSSKKTQTPAP